MCPTIWSRRSVATTLPRVTSALWTSPASWLDDAGADQRFYASRSHDKKKNPLDYNMKVGQLKKMFPQHSQNGTPTTT